MGASTGEAGLHMSQRVSEASAFLPLSNLSFHILLALGDAPVHGYGIGKEVASRSEGRLNPTTGGLYQALKRMVEDGLVQHTSVVESTSSDSRRRYFQLTELGRSAAALEAARFERLVSVARERKLFPGPA